jgi:hypothetical protein
MSESITCDYFQKNIKKYDLSKIIVLKEHEKFWRLVARVNQ